VYPIVISGSAKGIVTLANLVHCWGQAYDARNVLPPSIEPNRPSFAGKLFQEARELA